MKDQATSQCAKINIPTEIGYKLLIAFAIGQPPTFPNTPQLDLHDLPNTPQNGTFHFIQGLPRIPLLVSFDILRPHICVNNTMTHMYAFGIIWQHLRASGSIWKHLEASGSTWPHPGWQHLEASRILQHHLAAAGSIWHHLAASGAIWAPPLSDPSPGAQKSRKNIDFCETGDKYGSDANHFEKPNVFKVVQKS